MNTPSISNMFSARETSRDASFVKLVNSIFTEKTVSEINKEMYRQMEILSTQDLAATTDGEKCKLFIEKFLAENELTDTDTAYLQDMVENADFTSLVKREFFRDNGKHSIEEIKGDKKVQAIQQLFEDSTKDGGENILRMLTGFDDDKFNVMSQIMNLDIDNIDPSMLKSVSIDDIGSLVKDISCVTAMKSFQQLNQTKKKFSEVEQLRDMIIARNIINLFPEIWKKLYLVVSSPADFMGTVSGFAANQYMKLESKEKVSCLMLFLNYAFVYSEKWKEYQFGLNFIECVKDPMNLVMLVEFISKSPADGGSPYSNCFCKNFDAFLKEKGYDLNIDFLSFIKEQPLMKDKDPEHKTWYINILNSKVDGTLNDELNYNKKECVKKLYAKMKENGYIISNCTEDLFVYRLTGFGTAYDPKEYIITVNLNNAELGYIIRCLLSDERNTPDGLTCAQNFFISKSGKSFNLAYAKAIDFTRTNNVPSLKKHFDKAVQILTDCGFSNVDKIYLKGSRGEYKKKSK